MGGSSSQIATLVERHSRYVMLVKVPGKDTATVTKALAKKIRELPAELRLDAATLQLTVAGGPQASATLRVDLAARLHPRAP